jgi:Flp pilus assembly protein TadG
MVETAMVLPILLVLVFGMIDFGRVFNAWITVTNSAREGARVGATRQDESAIEARVAAAMGHIDDYTVDVVNAGGSSGTAVSVSVETTIDILTPLIGDIIGGGSVTISETTTMRLE